jgi:phospholipid-binding lipoprotein MlaA
MIFKNLQSAVENNHASGYQKPEMANLKSEVGHHFAKISQSRNTHRGLRFPVIRFWFSVFCLLSSVLAVMISGCAASAKSARPVNVAPNSAGTAANSDFDLLEAEYAEQMVEVSDPLEPFNRVMFNVNDTLYFWVVKPGSEIYAGIVPEPARIGIRNFFSNLTTPVRLVNCLLQGKGEGAGIELRRFAINTTCGILGFGDPALGQYGLEPVHEDLGQTLAVYGFGDGFYLVLPLFGPSNARDSIGSLGDWFLNPVSYVEPDEAAYGITAVKFTNNSSLTLGEYESFKASTIEPYIAMRRAYAQYRAKQIEQ